MPCRRWPSLALWHATSTLLLRLAAAPPAERRAQGLGAADLAVQWTNGFGDTCEDYSVNGWCAGGAFTEGGEPMGLPGLEAEKCRSNGDANCSRLYNHPALSCAACGAVQQRECPRPASGCEADGDIYLSLDCDGDGTLDHLCTTADSSNRRAVLSLEGCLCTTDDAVVHACPRLASGCQAGHDVYSSLDCDGDGTLDHVCTTTINSNRSAVLSSEGCPSTWPAADFACVALGSTGPSAPTFTTTTALPLPCAVSGFLVGDGVGGTELGIGSAASPAECAERVREECPDADGATLQAQGHGYCYCEFSMTASNGNVNWQTCSFEWMRVVVLDATGAAVLLDVGEAQFNRMFARCPVVRYLRNQAVHSVYVRLPQRGAVNAYSLFTYTWASENNTLNQDFRIFDSEQDARASSSAWTHCNYDDSDIGYPRDCGKTGRVNNQWFSMPGGRGRIRGITFGASFEIYTGDDCPDAETRAATAGTVRAACLPIVTSCALLTVFSRLLSSA